MKALPVELAGPTYKDRSGQMSCQKTQNLYLGPGLYSKWAAYDFFGCKAYITDSGQDRGLYVFNEQLYRVLSNDLILIAVDGVQTVVGTVGGIGRCIFDDDGVNIFIASGGQVFQYNGTTVVAVTSPNLETPNSVSYLNGFFLYDGDEGRFQASDAGDGATINDLSVGVANSDGDRLLRGFVHSQLVYWYGARSIEPWFYSGTGELPFDRLEQGFIPLGLGATYSVAADEDSMYFLGANKQFYKLSRSVATSISTPGLANEIEAFDAIDDAIGWTLTFQGQQFYWVNFPSQSKSYLYSVTYNYWVDLSYGMDGERHLANSYAYCYGKHYVTDYRNGNLYELDLATRTDNGDPILRFRDSAPITGQAIGLPGHRVIVGSLRLDMQVGVGLAAGQGSDPEIMFEVSGDGAKSFSGQEQVSMGEMGAYGQRVNCDKFWSGQSIVYRLLCSDPIYWSFWGGIVDADDGGY